MGDEVPAERGRAPGPPMLPDPYVLMEETLEKLKILNYEQDFCTSAGCGLLLRTQFSEQPSNPAENFKIFASLVQWLMALNGNYTEQWDRFTDPNVTVTNMTSELRKVGINMDIPPHKLKQGHGSEVCIVLNNLVDITLQKKGFRFERPRHHPDAYAEETPMDDGVEGGGDEMDDEIGNGAPTVAEDEEEMYVAAPSDTGYADDKLESSMLESKVDPHQWRMELERVAPQLKVVLHTAAKEWRTHLDQAVSLEKQINEGMPKTQQTLSHISEEISEAVAKISSREKLVNQNCDILISEFQKVKQSLNRVEEQYAGSSGTITDRTNELAQISEELDLVKSKMDQRGNSMTDTSPLLDIKKALARIKAEVKQMDLRIGAVEHTLLEVAKKAMSKTTSASPASSAASVV